MTATTPDSAPLTRMIAGHAFTLTAGRRYLATRPMARFRDERFDVSITDTTDGVVMDRRAARVVKGLTYDRANELLNAFNDGAVSFAGRVWE